VVEAGPGVETALPREGTAAAVAGAVVDVLGEELLDPGRVVVDELFAPAARGPPTPGPITSRDP
jgi:hypothetical protein